LDPGRKNILIPASALVPVLNGQIVYLIKNGRSIATPVKTGIRTEREVEITEGIKPNDTIALTGLLQLKDSLEVTVNLKH
ncbi:MAG TPA: efflux transporter periplasmic adaptor subunit, partial [Bacteroidales bacterium]|nr:efflux transporter periplasmic adaptor subunit [Bacteroidales bacterium]